MLSTNIIYQAYGNKTTLDQAIYSILSLIPYIKTEEMPIKVIIYTDNTKYFRDFFTDSQIIFYEDLSSETRIKWLGNPKFVHRLKIEMLKHASEKFQGNILYLDGDTYFTKSPSEIIKRILPSVSVMHTYEDILKPSKFLLTKKLYKFLYKTSIFVDDEHLLFKDETQMWNAGVIGVHEENKWVFEKILKMTDALYSKYQKHIMEQFAVSYYLQSYSHIVGCEDVVEHYWMQKEIYPPIISNFITKNPSQESFFSNITQLKLPKRVYKNPYATFRMRVYQKVPLLRPLILKLNSILESPNFK